MHSCLAETKRINFMNALKTRRGRPHLVHRSAIFDSVTTLYKSSLGSILEEYPFRIKYNEERAVYIGGVARDMFSAFFYEVYNKMFDGASLLVPTLLPHIDISTWSLLGTIISHAFLVCGILPIRIALPCLSCVLLNRGDQLPQEILTETFIDSLSYHDATSFKQAFQEVKEGSGTTCIPKEKFSSLTQSVIFSVLSRYGCREMPTPRNLYKLVNQVAKYQFLMVPASAYAQMKSGIPNTHIDFWNSMSLGELYSLYRALHTSPSKILQLIEEPVFDNPAQQRVFLFLCDFIGNMKADETRTFLRFVTGSSVCMAKKIRVTFNNLDGFARRPVSHTCSLTLELSVTYKTSSEFVTEFQEVLRSDQDTAWWMDAI